MIGSFSQNNSNTGTVFVGATAGSNVLLQFNGNNNVPITLNNMQGVGANQPALVSINVNSNTGINAGTGALFTQNLVLTANQGIGTSTGGPNVLTTFLSPRPGSKLQTSRLRETETVAQLLTSR